MTILPTPYPTIPAFSADPVSITLPDGRIAYPGFLDCPAWVFYGQQGEDLDVFVDFFRESPVEKGVFVEVGAGNGVEFSNTHFFEKSLGWRGVLVEPNPAFTQLLKEVRPGSYVAPCVAGSTDSVATFAIHEDKWAQSHRTDVNSDILQRKLSENSQTTEITVPVRRLGDILHEANISYVDFLSVDVEGSEIEVLEGMDWSIPIHVVVVEMTAGVCPLTERRVGQVVQTLKDEGFVFHKSLGCNEVWVNPTYLLQRSAYVRPQEDQG